MRRGFLLPSGAASSSSPPRRKRIASIHPSSSSSSSSREAYDRRRGDDAPPSRGEDDRDRGDDGRTRRNRKTTTTTRSRALLDLEGTTSSSSMIPSPSCSSSLLRSLVVERRCVYDDDDDRDHDDHDCDEVVGEGRAVVVFSDPDDGGNDDDDRRMMRPTIFVPSSSSADDGASRRTPRRRTPESGGGSRRMIIELEDDGGDKSLVPATIPRDVEGATDDDDDDDDDDDSDADDAEELVRFANDASLSLARLRRHISDDDCVKAEATIRAFASRNFPDRSSSWSSSSSSSMRRRLRRRLDGLWKVILGPIAVDCHRAGKDDVRSGKGRGWKGRSRTSSHETISPALALGLGAIESLATSGAVAVAYDGLAGVLSGAARTVPPREGGDDDHDEAGDRDGGDARARVSALGAVCLLRCRIRRIGVATHHPFGSSRPDGGGEGSGTGFSKNDDDARELGMLLSTVLSPLEGIVNDGEGKGRTVLKSAASDAFFELIESSSRAFVLEHSQKLRDLADTVRVWRDVLPLVERLLVVNQRWWISMDGERCQSSDRDRTQSRGDFLRAKCAAAVFIDWSDVVRTSRRMFFDHFVGDDLHDDGADHSAGLNLFWNLSGISLKSSGEGKSSKDTTFRVGGIAQSLCRDRKCVLGSSIGGLSCDLSGSVRAKDLVPLLQEAAGLTDSIQRARQNAELLEAWTKENHQRAAVRAFASWMSMDNKAIRVLSKSSKTSLENAGDLLDNAMSCLVMLLRSESKQCVALSIATLSILLSAAPEWMPRSFSDLLDALTIHSSTEMQSTQQISDGLIIDPTSCALCMIVARVASQRPTILLPYILSMKGRVEIKIEVILSMLDQLPNSQSDGSNGGDNNEVYHAATKMLLQNIDFVPYLRSRLLSNPSFFSSAPVKLIVPEIVQYLIAKYAQRKTDSGMSSLAGLLCNIMRVNANSGRAEDFVGCLMSSLQTANQEEICQESQTAFFNKNGPLWRRALLDESSSSDSAYKEVMLATAKSMIEMPSSITPLSLLASLVDSQFRPRPSDDDAVVRLEKRIFLATSGIIHFSMNHVSPSPEDVNLNQGSIFSRIAPLLILRRMPRSYYSAVHNGLQSDRNTYDAMVGLVAFLSKSLKSHAAKNDKSNLLREEKKLLAELAGHCLPFSNKVNHEACRSPDANELPVSLVDNFCVGPFSDTLKLLRKDRDILKSDADESQNNCLDKSPSFGTIVSIRQAKTALYAVSHHVPLGLDEDNGEALIKVASFAFEVLNFQTRPLGGAETSILLREEISMLQSGCTHFIVISVDSLSCRMAQHIGPSEPHPLIEDIGCRLISQETKYRIHSFLWALSEIFHTLISTITTGEYTCMTMQFSPSSRTAMLNSIVMLAQGSRAEDGRLTWLASNILPTLVTWTSMGPIDENIHHALCIAASLQVIYTLLARCGSFGFLGHDARESDFVCRTLRCALRSFHAGADKCSPCASALLRLAALKVILTVIALDRANEMNTLSGRDLGGYLSPREIRRAMSALNGAANVDQDPEVRRLANEILPYLHTTS